MKLRFTTIFCLAMCATAAGQINENDSNKVETIRVLKTHSNYENGYFKGNLSSINSLLKAHGIDPISEHMHTLFVPGLFQTKQHIIAINLFAIASTDYYRNPPELLGKVVAFGWGASYGFNLLHSQKYLFYPYGGFSMSRGILKIEDHSQAGSVSSIIGGGSRRDVTLHFNQLNADLGLHAERIFQIKSRTWDCPQYSRFIALGIRGGYFLPLNGNPKGRYDNQTLSDSPSFALKGFHASVTFGYGRVFKRVKWK